MRQQPLAVADLVNILFDTVRDASGKPYTEVEVSKAIDVSFSTINHLRTGRSNNPALATIRGLCKFFNVPLNYFEAETLEECQAIIAKGRQNEADENPAINEIMLRATNLSEKSQEEVLRVIQWVQNLEREKKRTQE